MPDFEIVSVEEAQSRTIPGRRGTFLNEYAAYIKELTPGQAGKLHILEQEKPATIRRRLVVAAKALGVPLTIKRSGQKRKRSYTRRRGLHEDIAASGQPFRESGAADQGVTEESPALGEK
jgi:hypothetical protein